MPHLRALVERLKDEPFALIGVNTGDSEEAYRKGVEDYGVSWTCAWQGPRVSPISDLFRVRGYPTILVLDGEGRIRHRGLRGASLGEAVDELLAEARQSGKGEGRSD